MGGFLSRLFGTHADSGGTHTLVWDGLSTRPHSGQSRPAAWDQIEPILRGLDGGDGFVILSTQPERYIQAAVGVDGLIVEYRDGSEGGHFSCVDPMTLARTAELFRAYFEDPATIAGKGRWNRVEI